MSWLMPLLHAMRTGVHHAGLLLATPGTLWLPFCATWSLPWCSVVCVWLALVSPGLSVTFPRFSRPRPHRSAVLWRVLHGAVGRKALRR